MDFKSYQDILSYHIQKTCKETPNKIGDLILWLANEAFENYQELKIVESVSKQVGGIDPAKFLDKDYQKMLEKFILPKNDIIPENMDEPGEMIICSDFPIDRFRKVNNTVFGPVIEKNGEAQNISNAMTKEDLEDNFVDEETNDVNVDEILGAINPLEEPDCPVATEENSPEEFKNKVYSDKEVEEVEKAEDLASQKIKDEYNVHESIYKSAAPGWNVRYEDEVNRIEKTTDELTEDLKETVKDLNGEVKPLEKSEHDKLMETIAEEINEIKETKEDTEVFSRIEGKPQVEEEVAVEDFTIGPIEVEEEIENSPTTTKEDKKPLFKLDETIPLNKEAIERKIEEEKEKIKEKIKAAEDILSELPSQEEKKEEYEFTDASISPYGVNHQGSMKFSSSHEFSLDDLLK